MFDRFLGRLENKCKKGISEHFGKRTIRLGKSVPFVSFTFDDFPRSAFLSGGKILEKYEIRGSYYASLGLMGQETVLGEIFTSEDLKAMVAEGHEIGSHSFDHLNPWETRPEIFEASIIRNQEAMSDIFPGFAFKTLAYPYTQPHPRIKKVAAKYFCCCRGGGQISNEGRIDLNLLKSYFIDKKRREDLDFFRGLIRRNSEDRGWLIFSTHDISVNPSTFGCSPGVFESIVREAKASGATILPICEVYSRITS